MFLPADDHRLTWPGAAGVVREGPGVQPWRLPPDELDLHPDPLREVAAMPSGVRLAVVTDAPTVSGQLDVRGLDDDERATVDVVVDGARVPAPVQEDGRFGPVLPPGQGARRVELWLPQYGRVRVRGLDLPEGSVVRRAEPAPAGLLAYGSSITQGRQAASPSRTWPAQVSLATGLPLVSRGFAGQCLLDPLVGRHLATVPARVVLLCLGINVYGAGSHTLRSLAPAVLGLLRTVRDGHPGVPIVVMTPIHSPEREEVPGAGGMSLVAIRDELERCVALLRRRGDDHLHLLAGPDVLGPRQAGLLVDGVHPGPRGHDHLAERVGSVLGDRGLLPRPPLTPGARG